MPPSALLARAAALAIVAAVVTPMVRGQARFRRGTVLYEQEMAKARVELDTLLKSHPELVDVYFPSQFSIPTQFYR